MYMKYYSVNIAQLNFFDKRRRHHKAATKDRPKNVNRITFYFIIFSVQSCIDEFQDKIEKWLHP